MPLPSILLVEDDVNQLELLNLVLRHLPNPIRRAHGGEEALSMIADEIPGVIVLDIAMPGIDGLGVLQVVRSSPRLRGTRVVIVTAVPERVTNQEAAQVEQMIAKPFDPLVLVQTVKDLLRTIQ